MAHSVVCSSGGDLDQFGNHRAACPTAGVLVRRAWSALRRACREAGVRVAPNVFLRDLNLGLSLSDGRRCAGCGGYDSGQSAVARREPLAWRKPPCGAAPYIKKCDRCSSLMALMNAM